MSFVEYHCFKKQHYTFKVSLDQLGSCVQRETVGPTLQATIGLKRLYERLNVNKNKRSRISEGQEEKQISILYGSRYEFVDAVGSGTFSNIVSASDTFKSKRLAAIKLSKLSYDDIGRSEIQCLRYLKSLRGAEFVPIVFSEACFLHESRICMVMDLYQTNLSRYTSRLQNRKKSDLFINEIALKKIFLNIVTALKFLQRYEIIHADIKPANILLSMSNGAGFDLIDSHILGNSNEISMKNLDVKICDFGNAFHSSEANLYYDKYELQTVAYRAPEVLYGCPFTPQIDVYSAGIVILELIIGHQLFLTNSRYSLAQLSKCLFGNPSKNVLERGVFRDEYKKKENVKNIKGCCSCCWIDNNQKLKGNCKGNCVKNCERIGTAKPFSLIHLHRIISVEDCNPMLFQNNQNLVSVLAGLLDPNPLNRLNPDSILMSPYFSEIFPFEAIFENMKLSSNNEETFSKAENDANIQHELGNSKNETKLLKISPEIAIEESPESNRNSKHNGPLTLSPSPWLRDAIEAVQAFVTKN